MKREKIIIDNKLTNLSLQFSKYATLYRSSRRAVSPDVELTAEQHRFLVMEAHVQLTTVRLLYYHVGQYYQRHSPAGGFSAGTRKIVLGPICSLGATLPPPHPSPPPSLPFPFPLPSTP